MRHRVKVAGDSGVVPLLGSGRTPAKESDLLEHHLFVVVLQVVQPRLQFDLLVEFAPRTTFGRVPTGPVDQRFSVQERETGLVRSGAKAVQAILGDPDPALVDTDVVVRGSEGVVTIGNSLLVPGPVTFGAGSHQLLQIGHRLGVVSFGTLDRGKNQSLPGHPASLGGAGTGPIRRHHHLSRTRSLGIGEIDEELRAR